VLAACQPPFTISALTDLPSLAIDVQTSPGDADDGPLHLSIVVNYDYMTYLAQHDECAVARSDLVARFDQTPVPITDPGYAVPDDTGFCSQPIFESEIAPGTSGEHHVTLPGGIAMDFADGDLVPRTATPVSGEWVLSAGQSFTMTWSIPSDLTLNPPDAFHTFFYNTAPPLAVVPLDATVGSDTLTLAVPADPPTLGSGALSISLAWVIGSAVECTGATQCSYLAVAGVHHTATLQSPLRHIQASD
jgi:hypothetical protein